MKILTGIHRQLKIAANLAGLMFLFGIPPTLAQVPRSRVAVLEFQASAVSAPEAAAVTDRFRTELVRLGVFTVLERAQTDTVLNELAFQQQGLTAPEQAARVGRMLNVQHIVTGRVTRVGSAYQVSAGMIRVETAVIERSETIMHRGDIVGLLSTGVAGVAARLARVAPASVAEPSNGTEPASHITRPRSSWPLWAGGAAVVGALVLENSARQADSAAAGTAESARQRNDATLYKDSRKQQAKADSGHQAALALGAAGLGLIAYHALSDDPAQDTRVGGSAAPPVWQVGVASGVVVAQYRVRW